MAVSSGAMRTVVVGERPGVLQGWLEQRQRLEQDGRDEVWEGEYHVVPMAHGRHGDVDDQLAVLLRSPARAAGLWPSGSINIGDPDDYRVPDRAYRRDRDLVTFFPNAAIVVEIVSPGDETYAKLPFYARRGVEEVLIVDPLLQTVAWYTLEAGVLHPTARSALLDIASDELAGLIDWPL